jgi:hypothetical protein
MSQRTRRLIAVGLALALPAIAVPLITMGTASAAISVTKIEGTATDAAGLATTVDAYRALLGAPNNGSALGSQPAGRREINWDGTPDAFSSPNRLPRDFFNTTVPRGAVFNSNAGANFQVSANLVNPTNTPVRFGNINKQYPKIFTTFSPQRLFTPIGTNKMWINFFVPGSTTRATVKGFGAVFTDVDRSNSTSVGLYDRNGNLLWSKFVLKGPASANSLSFLGVLTTADIYEVRITSGNKKLSPANSDNSSRDVVAMDDFLYAEPQPLI